MATTTNYSWTTPDDTDLVKDGAAAIRTLGSSIDTTTKNLNPQTTTGAIAYRSATSNVNTALAIGTAGQVLTVNSGATAPEWATPAAGGAANWTLLNAGGTALTGAATITVSGISGKDKIWIILDNASSANASAQIRIRLNTDTGSNYYAVSTSYKFANTYLAADFNSFGPASGAGTSIGVADMANNAASVVNGSCLITGCNSSGVKVYDVNGGATAGGGADPVFRTQQGYYNSASTISSVSAFSASGNFDNGTIYVYASA